MLFWRVGAPFFLLRSIPLCKRTIVVDLFIYCWALRLFPALGSCFVFLDSVRETIQNLSFSVWLILLILWVHTCCHKWQGFTLVRFPVRAYSWVAGLVPHFGACERQPTDVSLSHQCFSLSLSPSLPLSLKINKQNIWKKRKLLKNK